MTRQAVCSRETARFWRSKIVDGARSLAAEQQLARLTGEYHFCESVDRQQLIDRIRRELRIERSLARNGSRRYDLGRHVGLLQALRAARVPAKSGSVRRAGRPD